VRFILTCRGCILTYMSVMKCPRCVQQIHRAAAACPHCGFSLSDADQLFGKDEIKLRTLTDTAGIFRRHERDLLEELLERISLLFPQIFVAIYTGSLGESGHLRQFGFWLLNRGVFEDIPIEKPNENGILIVIDPDSKSAGMTHGYLLDPFLEEKDSFDCLSRAHAYWLEGRYAEGALRTLRALEQLLKKRCRQARRDPEKYERRHAKSAGSRDVVRKLRERDPNQTSSQQDAEQEVKR
jgi:uncharacterized membrane protein YgcG